MNSRFAIEIVARADVGFLVSSKGEHGQRDGDRDVYSDLSRLDLVRKFTCSGAVVGKDGGAVAPLVAIHDGDRLVKSFRLQSAENGPENLFLVTSSKRLNKVMILHSKYPICFRHSEKICVTHSSCEFARQ